MDSIASYCLWRYSKRGSTLAVIDGVNRVQT